MISWGPKIETGNLLQPQLYDMKHSPAEARNVADEHPQRVEEFEALISAVEATKGYKPEKKIK